jgi:hypothetical protein
MNYCRSKEMKKLLNMAQNGHYPLFESEWIKDVADEGSYISSLEKKAAAQIFVRLRNSKDFVYQKRILAEANVEERKAFVKVFLRNVASSSIPVNKELH